MPDDEGAGAASRSALVAARSRIGPLLEVGTYCGKSAVYLGAAARESRRRADHRRSSPGLGGEPGRAGSTTTRPWSTPAAGGWTRFPWPAGPWRTGPGGARGAGGGRLDDRGGGLDDAAGPAVHRRRSRAEVAWADYRGLDAEGGRRAATWPSTTSSPTRPRAAGRPTSCTARPGPPVGSSRSRSAAAACGCYAGGGPTLSAASRTVARTPPGCERARQSRHRPQRSRDAPDDRRPGRALVRHADRHLPHGQAAPLGAEDQLGVEDVPAELAGLHEGQQAARACIALTPWVSLTCSPKPCRSSTENTAVTTRRPTRR